MSKKTLVEAAAAVLSEAEYATANQDLQGQAASGQQPRHVITPAAGDILQNTTEVGGSTTEQPQGPSNPGARSAAGVNTKRANPVVNKNQDLQGNAKAGQMTRKTIEQPSDTGPSNAAATGPEGEGSPQVQPAMATPSGEAPTKGQEAGDVLYHGANHAVGEEVEAEPTAEEKQAAHEERVAAVKDTIKELSVDEDVNAIFTGTDLSPELREKIKTVFEAAVIARAVMVVEKLEAQLVEASEQAIEEIKEELEGNVDAYLDHMVEEWRKENEVALTSGLRAEIAEEFIDGLRTLFLEHNMDIPEEQVSVVEELTAKVEELEGKLNETLNNNVTLTAAVNSGKQEKALSVACEGLTATQADKMRTLAEGVPFTSEGEYAGKLKVIREQYFSGKGEGKKAVTSAVALNESGEPAAAEGVEIAGTAMGSYVAAIGRTNPKN